MSKDRKTPRRRIRTLAVGAGIAGAAAAVGVGLFLGGATSPGTPQATAIPALAPANSDTMVLAPYTADWWDKVAAMAPQELMLRGLTPAPGLSIEHIGYSRSQDKVKRAVAGPLRVFYIEAADDAGAQRIMDWLARAPGFEHRNLGRDGKVITITAVWVDGYTAPSKSMATVAGYRPELTDKQGSMYFNPKLEISSLTGTSGGDTSKLLTSYMEKGLGFSGDTAWTGTSKDGDSWAGSFMSGGVDPAQLNFPAVSEEFMAQQHIVATYTEKPTKTQQSIYEIVAPGISSILGSSTVSAPSQKGQLGTSVLPSDVHKVDGAEVTAVQNLNEWNRAATGNAAVTEDTLSRTISATKDKMVLSFTYRPDSPNKESERRHFDAMQPRM